MNKYNSLGSLPYNSLDSIRYNDTKSVQRLVQLVSRLGPRPIVLDQSKRQVAILENCFDCFIEQEVGGMDEISFSLPIKDSKRSLIANEGYVQMFDTIYVIREVVDRKKDRITEVYAEAIWYDIQYSDKLDKRQWRNVTPEALATDLLSGTGWKIGTIQFSDTCSMTVESIETNRLQAINQFADILGAEIVYDTQAMEVSFMIPVGIDTGAGITYEKNAEDIEARYDTRDLITKLYLYGKNDMSIKDANSGVEFLEDYSYTSKVMVRTVKDERYTNPFTLKAMGERALAYLCKPRASYFIKMAVLSDRSGHNHEKFFIGGLVRVFDKEINLNQYTRIMKWRYNVIEPWRTELSLESKAKEISDLLTGLSDGGDSFTSEDAVKEADMLNLSVFNYLMNSRADDGYSYWTNTGWSIDPSNGFSGNSSFKAVGELGETKEMFQSVWPSNQETYAISMRAYANNIQKGENGKVGVEVTVTYEDDTTETIFISLV